jgi:hypothetical protein
MASSNVIKMIFGISAFGKFPGATDDAQRHSFELQSSGVQGLAAFAGEK